MPPTIRIDEEVFHWLQGQAVPFDDTPNSVLRRIAGFGDVKSFNSEISDRKGAMPAIPDKRNSGRNPPLIYGKKLIPKWKIPVLEARFHRDGCYYEHLTKFPAAFCDREGYIIFETREDYRNCPNLKLGQQVNVKKLGISSIPGYQKVDDPV